MSGLRVVATKTTSAETGAAMHGAATKPTISPMIIAPSAPLRLAAKVADRDRDERVDARRQVHAQAAQEDQPQRKEPAMLAQDRRDVERVIARRGGAAARRRRGRGSCRRRRRPEDLRVDR